jgi:hypothetical protein
MENQHHQQPLEKKARRKINTSTLSATAIASTSSASIPGDMVINIEQTLPILCPEQPSAEIFLAKMHKIIFYSRRHHWNHQILLQEKGGAWSALILEERIECMNVQEEVEGQNVNSHKFFPNLLIWVICILFGVYKFLNGSVIFLMHKYVSRRISRSQNKYISGRKKWSR